MNRSIKFTVLFFILSSCTQSPSSLTTSSPNMEGGSTLPKYDYSDSTNDLNYVQSELLNMAQGHKQGVCVETLLSPLARKLLSNVSLGDMVGYHQTITHEAYGGEGEYTNIAILSPEDLRALSQSKGYFSTATNEDDVIIIHLRGRDNKPLALQMHIAFSMPQIIFLEYSSQGKKWECAIINHVLWYKIYKALLGTSS